MYIVQLGATNRKIAMSDASSKTFRRRLSCPFQDLARLTNSARCQFPSIFADRVVCCVRPLSKQEAKKGF